MLGRYVTDVVFRSTVVRIAEARGAATTWVYRFAWVSPTQGWAMHCLDVPFWFDCLDADGVAEIAGDAPPRAARGRRRTAPPSRSSATATRAGPPGPRHPGVTRVFGGEASRPDVDADGYASVRALL